MSYTIALAGNPNSGKTTVFNALTGSKQHVGNWPGVTVEKKEGAYKKDKQLLLLDLPGTYSLSPYTPEEIIARDYIVNEKPDCVINIVDATSIERNLYLSMQIMETGVPTVIALNMMDEVRASGTTIDATALAELFGVQVVPVVARNGTGLDALMEAVQKTIAQQKAPKRLPVYDQTAALAKSGGAPDEAEEKQADLRYQFIGEAVKNAVRKDVSVKRTHLTVTDKIDSVLTNRIVALPIFAAIMYVLFACTFSENFLFVPELPSPGVWLAGLAEAGWGWLTDTLAGLIENSGASEWAYSLVIDGIMEAFGAIIGFLPLVLVLFLLMSVLEDCGYMARVAFVMDRIFRKFGLSGRSFIPLLMGFGCSVPACMATRTLESEKDRKITVMILPWFSCGAKLPIYLMFVATMFADNPTPVIFSIYFMGMAVGILGALFLNKVVFKAGESNFIMELPPYRLPTLRSVGIHSWEKIKGFAIKAGTIIFGATILIWLLSNFNFGGMADMEESFLASIGRAIKWLFYPLGFGTDWRPAVGILTGWIAKENIVTTFAQLYANITDEAVLEALQAGEETLPALSEVFSKVTAYAYMAFNLFCMPCFAAVGAIKRELITVKWTLRAVGFQMAAAYLVALLINIAGSLITGAAIFK